MWYSQSKSLQNGHIVRLSICQGASPLSYEQVIHSWQNEAKFRDFFIDLLTTSSFTAFRWETPPVNASTVNRPFEYVLIDSHGLARSPDRKTFTQHFATKSSVVTFLNLGRDAILVAPCPHRLANYSHLGAFLREAPKPQQHDLWRAVGHAMAKRLGPRPVWLSTAGDGVAWLHVRLDDSPKYYRYSPYRKSS